MEFERAQRMRMHLDIAPLIDTVFLLLIFFMLTTNFVVQPAIELTLPSSDSQEQLPSTPLSVTLSVAGTLYLQQQQVTLLDLRNQMPLLLQNNPIKTVVIHADEKSALGLNIEVMEVLKEAGAEEVVIAASEKVASVTKTTTTATATSLPPHTSTLSDTPNEQKKK